MSSLRQNFFACLPAIAGREVFAVLEKAGRGGGGGSVKEGRGRKPRALASSCYHGGGFPGIIPWEVGRVTESGLLLSESAYHVLCSLGQTCPAGLAAESQPVRHQQGGWVGCVLTD